MQTLNEWNEKIKKEWEESRKGGVLCPKCKEEMLKARALIGIGSISLQEGPPIQDVLCPNCGYQGEMFIAKEKIKKIEIPKVKLEPGEFTFTRIPLLEEAIEKINEIIDKR